MKEYTLTFSFKTNDEISAEDMLALLDTIYLQIEEPADLQGNELEFRTFDITGKVSD